MSGQTTQQQRDEHWREGSDVYQHTYAFHHAVLPTAKRSPVPLIGGTRNERPNNSTTTRRALARR